MESTAENLSVLARRTEPFSPSKRSLQLNYRPPLNISPCSLFPAGRPAVPDSTSSLSSPPPTPSNSSQSQPAGSRNSLTSAPPLSPEPRPSRQSDPSCPTRITLNDGQPEVSVCPPTPSEFPPSAPASNILTPTTISASNQHIYHVLPLSPLANPGQPLVHTSHDLILPPTSAFSSSMYPIFTTIDCTWQYILDRVVNPSFLWSSYAPSSLGDYADVKSIWQAWDEGAYIKDIGRKPALRLIDARWGNLESQETRKRKFPSWRPRNDNKVCSYFLPLAFYSQRKSHNSN